jgi:DNA-binding NarL/FixJ family response regulator
MDKKRVVILSNHSLFAEGVATRLRQEQQRLEIHYLDPHQQRFIEQIAALQPDGVIINATDTESEQICTLCTLLADLPTIRIIRLAVQEQDVQVITSQRLVFAEVLDLVDLLE